MNETAVTVVTVIMQNEASESEREFSPIIPAPYAFLLLVFQQPAFQQPALPLCDCFQFMISKDEHLHITFRAARREKRVSAGYEVMKAQRMQLFSCLWDRPRGSGREISIPHACERGRDGCENEGDA